MDPRTHRAWPAGPVGDAAWAGITSLNQLNHEMAFQGTSLLLMDRRDLAAIVERRANSARLEGQTDTWAQLIALCIAGYVSADRAEELRVDSGEAA